MKKFFTFVVIAALYCLTVLNSSAQVAPDFNVAPANQDLFHLYDKLDEGKIVLIELFFTSCPPCQAISDELDTLYTHWGAGTGNVEFISLSILNSDHNQEINNYINQFSVAHPIVGADGGSISATDPYLNGTFGTFFGTPTFILVKPDRSLIYNINGSGTAGKIAAINNAIQEAVDAFSPLNQDAIIDAEEHYVGNVNYDFNPYFEFPYNIKIRSGSSQSSNDEIVYNYDGYDTLNQNIGILVKDLFAPTSRYYIEPYYPLNHCLESLTTLDMVLTIKKILGIDTLSVYQSVAADVNLSKSITTVDLIKMRRVILQIDSSYDSNKTFFFVPESYNFSELTFTTNPINVSFIPIKLGDVSGIRPANLIPKTTTTRNQYDLVTYNDKNIKINELIDFNLSVEDQNLQGIQGEIVFDKNKVVIDPNNESNIYYDINFDKNSIKFVYLKQEFNNSDNFLNIRLKSNIDGNLSDAISLDPSFKNVVIVEDEEIPYILKKAEPPISEWKIAGNQLTRSNLPSNHEKLQIFDAASRLIYERELTADIYTFSLPQVNTKGIYFINISDGIKTQNLKWVSNGSY